MCPTTNSGVCKTEAQLEYVHIKYASLRIWCHSVGAYQQKQSATRAPSEAYQECVVGWVRSTIYYVVCGASTHFLLFFSITIIFRQNRDASPHLFLHLFILFFYYYIFFDQVATPPIFFLHLLFFSTSSDPIRAAEMAFERAAEAAARAALQGEEEEEEEEEKPILPYSSFFILSSTNP